MTCDIGIELTNGGPQTMTPFVAHPGRDADYGEILRARAVAVTPFSTAILSVYLLVSGGPARVHLTTVLMVVLTIWVPVVLVGEVQLAKQWAMALVACFVFMTIFHDYVTSIVVSKTEFSEEWWPRYAITFLAFAFGFVGSAATIVGLRVAAGRLRPA